MKKPIHVALIEDNPQFREVVGLALEEETDLELCAEFGSAEKALETLEGRPGNLPEVTGAAGERILGAVYFA